MRLELLNNPWAGQRSFLQSLKLSLARRLTGSELGAPTTMAYRSKFGNKHYVDLLHRVMHEPQAWSRSEIELIAAFVSQQNQCSYCLSAHKAVAAVHLDQQLIAQVLDDWQTAPITPQLKAALGFLQRLTREPMAVEASDMQALREAGLSEVAIEEAILVGFLFSVINRLADAFGFTLVNQAEYDQLGKRIDQMGYQIANWLG